MKRVEVKSQIKSNSETIIKAFLDSDMLKGWWSVERCLIENKIGGIYILAWQINDTGFGYVNSGTIKSFDPNTELVISNFVYMNPKKKILGPMSLTIRATEIDFATSEIYICQDGYQNGIDWDWYYEAVKGAWPIVIENLKKYIENHG